MVVVRGGMKFVSKKNLMQDIKFRSRAPKGSAFVFQGFMINSNEINQRASSVFRLGDIVSHR